MYLSFSRLEDYLDHLKFIGESITRVDWHEKAFKTEIDVFVIHRVYAVLSSLQYSANHKEQIVICQVTIGEVDSLQLKVNGSQAKELNRRFENFKQDIQQRGFTVLAGLWSSESPIK
jgi:hypothetical protein